MSYLYSEQRNKLKTKTMKTYKIINSANIWMFNFNTTSQEKANDFCMEMNNYHGGSYKAEESEFSATAQTLKDFPFFN